jgi:hypothetical protein
MSSEACRSKWAREREREREREERVEGAFIPLHTEKSRYSSKTRNSGKTLETPGSPETQGKPRRFQSSKVSTQKVNPVNVLVQRCLS